MHFVATKKRENRRAAEMENECSLSVLGTTNTQQSTGRFEKHSSQSVEEITSLIVALPLSLPILSWKFTQYSASVHLGFK